MKKLGLILIVILLAYSVTSVSAVDNATSKEKPVAQQAESLANQIKQQENQASKGATQNTKQLIEIQQHADTLAQERIKSLNNLLTRIQNDNRLTADEKNSIKTNINTAIDGITTTKNKVDADTDPATARNDARQIITNYKVYEIIIPKTQILIMIYNLKTLSTKIQSLTPAIQNYINLEKNNNYNTTQLQNSLDDMNTQLQNINTILTADKINILTVSVSTSDAKITFTSTRNDLATVRQDFSKIRVDIAKMKLAIQDLKNTTSAITPPITASTSAK